MLILQNTTASGNAARSLDEDEVGKVLVSAPGAGGLLYFSAAVRFKNALVLRGLTAWHNNAVNGGVVYADARDTMLLMSGVLAWENSATSAGGVVYCSKCMLLGTQLDSARAVDCDLPKGLPSLRTAAVNDLVAGGKPAKRLKELHRGWKGKLETLLVENTAGNAGGALHCEGCGLVVLRKVSLRGNAASNGGGLYATS